MEFLLTIIISFVSLITYSQCTLQYTSYDLAKKYNVFQNLSEESCSAPNLPDDTGLTLEQLVTKYRYPLELHETQTEDGYIISMHRMPFGKNSPPSAHDPPRPVVLIQVGLWCDAAAFILMGPERGLAYLLADQGYDVWLGNARGTTYSRRHATLNPNKKSFWKFSFHEMGTYDLPAMIDYILALTDQKHLSVIGHSQGGGSTLVLLSERPEYNKKIKVGIFLAPAAFLSNAKNFMLKNIAARFSAIQIALRVAGINELLPKSDWLQTAANKFCHDKAPSQDACAEAFFIFGGPDNSQLNRTMIPVIVGHIPAGASVQQLSHFIQLYKSGYFRKYDYGSRKNNKIYGTREPPSYNLNNVSIPTVLYAATDDWLVDLTDIKRLSGELHNVVGYHEIKSMNHIDFMWGIDAVPKIYETLFDYLRQYND